MSKLITTDFEGRIESLQLHDGQLVHAGDVVARLDTTELASKLAQAKAQRQAAQAQAARAGAMASNAARKARLEQRLLRVGASSPEAHRNAMSEASAAAAEGGVAAGQIHEASAQIEEYERLIASAAVTAPIDGVASVVKVKEGELAHKGTPIARVFDPGALVIRFAVPRDQLARVPVGGKIQLVTREGRIVPGTVQPPTDDHDPGIDFMVFEATIAAEASSELRVGDTGHVRITDQGAGS